MASRAFGALFALAAGIAFVVSIATSAWWAGHPTIDGHFTTAKDVHVGPLGAEGCNTGGDGSCEPIQVDDTFQIVTYAELGASGLAALLALATAIAALKISDNRKGLAKASLLVTILAGGGGGAVLALGPGIQASQAVEVPLGYGLYIFAGAIGASLLGALLTRTVEPEPLRLKPSNAPLLPPAPVDVRQMLQGHPDGVRPSSLGPEPMLGAPAGTQVAAEPRESLPLFDAAPKLRPLYDPLNEGVAPVPVPAAHIPHRAPTPLSREQIEVLTGHAPPPLATPPRSRPPSAAPPTRAKPPSASPPVSSAAPSRSKPSTAPPAPMPASPRRKTPSVEPRPKQPRAGTLPAGAEPGVKKPIVAAPKVPAPAPRPPQPTKTHAVPPMPRRAETDDSEHLETSMMPAQRPSTEADDSLETAMRETESITSVEIDHEGKARAQHAAHERATTDARTGKRPTAPPGDTTDTGVDVAPAPREDAVITGEQRTLSSTERREAARAPTTDPFDQIRSISTNPPMHGAPISETLPAQRLSELLPTEHVTDESSDHTDQTRPAEDLMSTIEQNPQTPVPTIAARAQQASPPVAMSTAPSSLPPPKTTVEVPSGPTPACPQCEAPMAWVEEHLRFYCKSCRMYF